MNNSGTVFSEQGDKKSTSHFNKPNSLEFGLTHEQFIYIMNRLPKGYSLHQRKNNKRDKKESAGRLESQVRYVQYGQNISRLSGTFDIGQQKDQRKRNKKKFTGIDEEVPRNAVRRNSIIPTTVQKEKIQKPEVTQVLEDMSICQDILNGLKKHDKSYPFLDPVDPKTSGAVDYFDVIKEPMDISTVEKKLKQAQYKEFSQFKRDINKIWQNSYIYNDRTSPIYKMAADMEKAFKKIEASAIRKAQKIKSTKSYTIENNNFGAQKSQKNEQEDKPERMQKSEGKSSHTLMNLSMNLRSLSAEGLRQANEAIGLKDSDNIFSVNLLGKLQSSQIQRLESIVRKFSSEDGIPQERSGYDELQDGQMDQDQYQASNS